MTTYNHEKFIAQAIESVLMQKVNFDYELVIAEDCSTDRTREIVKNYQKKYPDKIRLLLRKKNLGGQMNYIQTLQACHGQYIAILDGDDFWTNPHKLQKQTDFLDKHHDFTACIHWAKFFEQETGKIITEKHGPPVVKSYYTDEDLLEYNAFFATSSIVFRNGSITDFPKWIYNIEIVDFPLLILSARQGKIGFIDEAMSAYRIHREGLYTGSLYTESSSQINVVNKAIKAYLEIGDNLNYKNNKKFKNQLSKMYFIKFREHRKINQPGAAFLCLYKSMIICPGMKDKLKRILKQLHLYNFVKSFYRKT